MPRDLDPKPLHLPQYCEPVPRPQELLPILQPNLSAASQAMRAATLRVLCCYNAPFAPAPASEGGGPGALPAPSDVLHLLLQIESQTCTTETGRRVRYTSAT